MKRILFILVAFISFTGCDKEKEKPVQNDFCADGLIKYRGNPAADGFGWIFRPANDTTTFFVLENLEDGLKKDNLSVHVCLYKTDKQFTCRCAQPVFYHHVSSIKRL